MDLEKHYGPEAIVFQISPAIPVSEWPAYASTALPPTDESIRYLLQLGEEGYAEAGDNQIQVSWENLFRLVGDAAHAASLHLLGLPQFADHVPTLESRGGFSDQAAFAIIISGWRTKSGAPLSGQVRCTGALLDTSDGRWLVKEGVWRLVDAVRAFAGLPATPRSSEENRRWWGRIREKMLEAGAFPNRFLDQSIILTPQELKLRMERVQLQNESVVVVEPSFEGAPANWLATFDAWKKVPDRYDLPQPGGGLIQVIVEPAVRAVLSEIKRMPGRRVAGRRAEALVRNPFALLGESASAVLTEESVDRAREEGGIGFSTATFNKVERDGEIGVEALISTAIGESVKSVTEQITTPHDLQALISEIHTKLVGGRLAYVWRGFEVDITGDTSGQVSFLESVLMAWQGVGSTQISYAEVFDLSRYSARIEGIGQEKRYYSPYIARKNDATSWIPGNVDWGISWIPQGQTEPVHLPLGNEGLKVLEAGIERAKAANSALVHLPGCPTDVPLYEAEAIALELRSTVASVKSGTFNLRTSATNRRVPRPSLILKPNIDALDYEEARRELAFDWNTPPKIPAALRGDVALRDHQRRGIAWLQHIWTKSPEAARGCLLADDMGLGKTLQLLTFIASCFEEDSSLAPALVVAPVSLLQNWSQEIEKFLRPDTLRVLPLYSATLRKYRADAQEIDDQLQNARITHLLRPGWRGNANLVLTTYETLRDLEFSLAAERWSIMVCDEAQRIKNPSAMITRAAKKLQVRFKIACTGTPVENTLADLWCLFDFFQPGYLGPLNEFGRKYRRPIEAETEEQRTAIAELQGLIEPQILRRLKTDVASDLPAKRLDQSGGALPMSTLQRQLYAQALQVFKSSAGPGQAGERAKNAHLGLLLRLRAVCADPRPVGLLSTANEPLHQAESRSPKLRWLMATLRGIRAKGDKVIIFTELREVQRMLQGYIEQAFAIRAPIINGDTSTAVTQLSSRQALIDRFQQQQGFGVLILSPLAVGFGVNIQAANHVIHYTRTWNPAKEDQATDRAYRIGQTKDVYVYTPTVIAPDFITFEAKLENLLSFKRALSRNMLDGTAEVNPGDFLDLGGPGGEPVFEETHIEDEHLHDFDPRAFEAFCQLLWQKMGYLTRRTGSSGDHGVDVLAWRDGEAILIQCKTSKKPGHRLGWDAVRDVSAGAAAYALQFPGYALRRVAVTNQFFNGDAVQQAGVLQVTLYTQLELLEMLAEHRPTHRELLALLSVH